MYFFVESVGSVLALATILHTVRHSDQCRSASIALPPSRYYKLIGGARSLVRDFAHSFAWIKIIGGINPFCLVVQNRYVFSQT